MKVPKSLSEKELVAEIRSIIVTSEVINSALEQAKKSHKNQYREDGQPFLTEHVYPVTKLALDFFKEKVSEEIVSSALLHDTLEDDDSLTDEMFIKKFNNEIFKIVKAFSKPTVPELKLLSETERRNKLNKAYFSSLSEASYETKVIKLLDRIDNLFWAMTFGEELVKIYIKETEEFYLPLAKDVDSMLFKNIHSLLLKLKSDAAQAGWI